MNTAKSSADESTYYAVRVVAMNDRPLDDSWFGTYRDEVDNRIVVHIVDGVENATSFTNESCAESYMNTMRKLYEGADVRVQSVSIDY